MNTLTVVFVTLSIVLLMDFAVAQGDGIAPDGEQIAHRAARSLGNMKVYGTVGNQPGGQPGQPGQGGKGGQGGPDGNRGPPPQQTGNPTAA